MKILTRVVFAFALGIFVQFSYAQEPVKAHNTESLKKEAFNLYQQRKYDEALKLAQRILQIKEKEFGSQHLEYASALADLATIELASGKMKSGEKTMRQAISIYESKTDLTKEKALELAEIFELIGFMKYRNEKPKDAVAEYRHALELKEKYTGTESIETSNTLWHLGNMYLAAGDYQSSFVFYERVVKIRSNEMASFGFDEVNDAVKRYECVAGKSKNQPQASALIRLTEEKIDKFFGQNVKHGGILNGIAINLVKPPNRSYGKSAKPWGTVEVQITIEETGRVIFACARSGYEPFYLASEEAALKSTFSPTWVDGKRVKVSGIIIYNFAP